MLKARVKLIYYFGLLGIVGLHLNLRFNKLEFLHPAEYIISTLPAQSLHETVPPLNVRLHFRSHYWLHNQGLSQNTDMDYFSFQRVSLTTTGLILLGVLKS